jgi:predicted flavoprotein YhiN
MESKKVPGLFFAGEILDIDGPSGGYNLQAAFSTARLAMDAIAKILGRSGSQSR